MLELNLWFSLRDGRTSGTLVNKRTQEKYSFGNLLSIQDFCNETIEKKILDMNKLSIMINDPSFDHDAMYGWTYNRKYLIKWNTKHDTAHAIYNNKSYELPKGVKQSKAEKAPDIYFRGPL